MRKSGRSWRARPSGGCTSFARPPNRTPSICWNRPSGRSGRRPSACYADGASSRPSRRPAQRRIPTWPFDMQPTGIPTGSPPQRPIPSGAGASASSAGRDAQVASPLAPEPGGNGPIHRPQGRPDPSGPGTRGQRLTRPFSHLSGQKGEGPRSWARALEFRSVRRRHDPGGHRGGTGACPVGQCVTPDPPVCVATLGSWCHSGDRRQYARPAGPPCSPLPCPLRSCSTYRSSDT